MKNYENSPKREPMRKRGAKVGSLTAHRRMVTGARNGSAKRAARVLERLAKYKALDNT